MVTSTIASWVNEAVFVSFFNAERSLGFAMYTGPQDIILTEDLLNSDELTTVEQWKSKVAELACEFMQANPRRKRLQKGSRA
jgi:hypothetical protein